MQEFMDEIATNKAHEHDKLSEGKPLTPLIERERYSI